MAQMLIRYVSTGQSRWGQLTGPAPEAANDTVDVRPFKSNPESTRELIAHLGGKWEFDKKVERIPASALLCPVSPDSQLVCQGLNYQEHAAEAQHAKRRSNLIFSKASSSLTGPFAPIRRPPEVQLLDYEVEIGLILRAAVDEGVEVTDSNIGEYVAGVVLCNDVSARDTMFGASFLQWFHGKSYRTFCPAGPVFYWLSPDEVSATLNSLSIKLWLNDELRQSASSAQLIYKPAETLTHLARYMDLRSGDMLLTGTPGGVTSPASPILVDILKTHLMADEARRDALRVEMSKGRAFMKAGDLVKATLHDDLRSASLGGLANPVVELAAVQKQRSAVESAS
jgi:2-keto-4-pentenoate hydratase/2-oxohepta-3-ene-1,7-dioic acid hydratase in catechol pathway